MVLLTFDMYYHFLIKKKTSTSTATFSDKILKINAKQNLNKYEVLGNRRRCHRRV